MSVVIVKSDEIPEKRLADMEVDGMIVHESGHDTGQSLKDHLDETDILPLTSRYGRAMRSKSTKPLEADPNEIVKLPYLQKLGLLSPVDMEKINGIITKEPQSSIENDPILKDYSIIHDKTLPLKDESMVCHFSVGELAWAQVGYYPYWPCVIMPDPIGQLHWKIRHFGRHDAIIIHVQYFGDNCRHGWVLQRSVISFTGLDDFNKLAETSNRKVKMKYGKLIDPYAAPKPPSNLKWETAIVEATNVLSMTNEERAEHFKPKAEQPKDEEIVQLVTSGRGKRRERFSDIVEPSAKRLKGEAKETDIGTVMGTPKRKAKKASSGEDEKMIINTQTPPTPPSSHNDSSDEWTVVKRDVVEGGEEEELEEKPVGDFEVFFERRHDSVKHEQPDTTESEIRIYLEKVWSNMSPTLRSTYWRVITKTLTDTEEPRIDREDESSIESDSRYNDKKSKGTTNVTKVSKALRSAKETSSDRDEESLPEWDSRDKHSKVNKKRKSPKGSQSKEEPSSDREEEFSLESDSRENKKTKKKKSPKVSLLKVAPSTDQEEESSIESDLKYHKKRKNGKNDKDETQVRDTVKKTRTKTVNLFRGTKQERVCQICERTGDLTRCKGPCYSYFHLTCVKPGESSSECSMDEDTMNDGLFEDLKEIKQNMINEEDDKNEEIPEDENFKCIDCLSGVAPACFICNEREEDRLRCSASTCGRHYHIECLKAWPQSHWQGGRLTCPYHMCHTCNSDNPQNGISWSSNEKLVRCVRCPSAYHPLTTCLPAGSEILTGSQIVCPKHYKALGPPLNATWCFLCTSGGSLICCDTCPTSFHPECLGIKPPDGAFICEDCETGRMPLYGEVVWVKLGNYRWWPSRICFPHEIPQNLDAISHRPGEFCVMFLGTNNYYWVHRGRAFLYQDGDSSAKASSKVWRKNVDGAFAIALEEANEIHQRLKMERVAQKGAESRVLRPPPYVKLKVNKPVGNVKPAEVESIGACDCDAQWDNPCAPETDCLNRILSVECSPGICPAGPKCNNQAFVRRRYPAMEPFHTIGRGWGLRTLESITEGQFVVEYVGEVIDEAEYKKRLHHKKILKNENFYFLTIDQSRMIDAEPKGNLSRFMNHSCMPNCETQKWTVNGDTRIGLFALRDIEIGEELTFNYNLACDGETRKPCLCGAPNCSGFIGLKAQKQKGDEDKIMKMLKVDEIEKNATVEKALKTEKIENAMKTERTPKSERAERISKLDKLQKTQKNEKVQKTPKAEKVEKIPKAEKVRRTPKVEKKTKIEKVDKTLKMEKVERTPRSRKMEKAPKPDKIRKTLKTEKLEKTPKTKKIVKAPKLKKVEKFLINREEESHDCWECGETLLDNYLECDNRNCDKKYHTACVFVNDADIRFSCPWHHCVECTRKTTHRCSFCSTAYCSGHLQGRLTECNDGKGSLICKWHGNMKLSKLDYSVPEKKGTDSKAKTDLDNSSLNSDSLLSTEKTLPLPREQSPRVAIVEVLEFSSEESEESQKEDSIITDNSFDGMEEKDTARFRPARVNILEKSSKRKKRHRKANITITRPLEPNQLETIIGGSINMEHNARKRC